MRILMVTPSLPTAARPGSLAPLTRQIESLRALGLHVEVLEVKGIPKLKYLQTWPTQQAYLPVVDLVHAHYGYCGWMARTQWRKPVIVSFMGDDLLGTPTATGHMARLSQVAVHMNRWLARAVDAVIVKSAEMAQVVSSIPAHIIPNGVDLQIFRPMERREAQQMLGWTASKRYILFPGNPATPRKGFPLAQVVVSHASRHLTAPLELVPLWGVAPDHVPLYMNGCDAMLLTSISEGSPNVVKEAMACNLPVVSVPVGDVTDLLSGVQGYTMCPRDATTLAEALLGVLQQTPDAKGRSALKQKGLDQESVARRILDVYEEVLTRRRQPRQRKP